MHHTDATILQQNCYKKMQLISNFEQITRTNTETDVLFGLIKMGQVIFPDFAIDNPLLKSPVKIQKLGVKVGQFGKIEICSQKDH